MKTHILMVLDESGSMASKAQDVIGGFKTFVSDQKASGADSIMTLVKFNTNKNKIYHAKPVSDIPELQYAPGGNTALFDAVAEAINIGDTEQADKVLCVVITDGEENSSRETTREQIMQIIKDRESRPNWTFAYLGVDPDMWSQMTGTHHSNTKAYDPASFSQDFATMSVGAANLSCSVQMSAKRGFMNDPAAVSLGRKGGLKGGKARADSLSPEQRSEIAKKAAQKRWFK